MLKIYCSECGSPTNYTSNKPKFCSGCGNPFDKTVINKVLNQKPTIINPPKKILPKIKSNEDESYDIEEDDDFQEMASVPDIKKLDCEIIESSRRGEKIKDLVGTSPGSVRQDGGKATRKKISKEERKKFLEDFSKEAGAIKPKTRIRKNVA